MNFWKMFFASLAGSIIAIFGVGLILIMLFAVALGSSIAGAMDGGGETNKVVKKNSVLEISLDAPIVERGLGDTPAFNFAALTGESGTIGLNDILSGLRAAATDDKIEGVYLNLSGASGGFSAITDIRDELVKFKESGKWMVAYSEGYSQGGYYLASAADELYMYPAGGMELNGLNAELMFYKDMLEKVGVEIQILRGPNNKYKSAVEPYFRNSMSDESRLQYQELLDDLWTIMVDDISVSRGITADQINLIADSMLIRVAVNAKELKLIDDLKYGDEVTAILKGKLSLEADEDINFINLADYKGKKKYDSEISEEVAVVYAVGAIESGEGDDATIGSDRIAEALRNARLDENTKAIVLRVNSPGGSALASDVIWRETQLIKEAKIPFVVSMSDLAASGGYYIACGADRIVASEATITGSIGVFGMLPNAQNLLENKIGVHTDRVGTNANGNIGLFSPLNETQYEAIEESISGIYDDFTSLVAQGRGMTQDAVKEVAGGRVWSGTDAIEAGLVDEIGTLERAKEIAAEMAGLDGYNVKNYPKLKDPFEEILKELGVDVRLESIATELGVDAATIKEINSLIKERNVFSVQARMPYSLKIN